MGKSYSILQKMAVQRLAAEEELKLEATCKELLQVRSEGSREIRRNLKFYNLSMILSVRSHR